MNKTVPGKNIGGRLKALAFLALVMTLAARWIGTAFAAPQVQMMNSSGNRNIKLSVDPIRKSEGYSTVVYDSKNGLPTSEANAIAQTDEGFIWIGSYAGLIRYDGNDFERLDSGTGISNVRCLYVDSSDCLWVGTNDSGVFRVSEGNITTWNKMDGLASVSIRVIAEDDSGLIYIGSTSGLAIIDQQLDLTMLTDERLDGKTIRELRFGTDGIMYGLTQAGDLFTMKNGALLSFLSHDECRVHGILSILPDPRRPGYLYLGTDHSWIYYGSLERNFGSMGLKDISPLSYTEGMEYIDGEIWLCTGYGIGKLDAEGFHRLENAPLNTSLEHVMTDHEGNLWFTSTRQGIMKVVPNQFSDLFERYGLPDSVVNTTCMYGPHLFIGTDHGLIVVEDRKRLDSLPLTEAVTASGTELGAADLLSYLDGVRIRSMLRDSQGRLWIATWRKYGLLRYDHGKLTAFTQEEGILTDQIRAITECEDGSIAITTTGGANVIRDDLVVGSYRESEGMVIGDALTVAEGFHHELIVGSDGNGIFVFTESGPKHISTADGLTSDVILRVKRSRSQDIHWIVTSNSLAYMTPDFKVTTIRNFPYPNNYDLYENSEGDVWVLASSGIYVISAEKLLADGPIEPVFYSVLSGLPFVATTNSYSELTDTGDLYIAGSPGVVKVNIETPFDTISEMRIALPYIDVDGRRIYPNSDGSFTVPRKSHKLIIYFYVFNYSLIDPQVSYRLEGFDSEDITINHSDLTPVSYTNLPSGVYNFVIQVKNPIGNANKGMAFKIVKDQALTVSAAGTIIMDLAALFFMIGLMIYTSLYRKRGRLDDRLFFGMIVTNAVLAASELISFLVEDTPLIYMRELMYAENTVFYAALELFPYLFLLYIDYRAYRDKKRINKLKLLYAIPCLLFFILLAVNLKTGWIFSITKTNTYHSGPIDQVVFIPLLLYFVLIMIRAFKINPLLVLLGVLLIGTRIIWDIWYIGISSIAFIYALALVCAHIHALNRQMLREVVS